MNVVYVSGSPREDSNTDYLLKIALACTGGQLIKLSDYGIEPCRSCWACSKLGRCVVDDDMSEVIVPKLLACDALVLGTPVYFNNVTAQLKAFMDRTWSLRGKLRNKIGGAVVVGRRYGAEGATSAINAFLLKHEMIAANRGVCGIAFEAGQVGNDQEAVAATERLAQRILELAQLVA